MSPLRSLIFIALLTAPIFGKKPNLIFFFGDDIRNTSLGIVGHPILKTPNLDNLARKGVRFENAFVNSPVCWSSRATVLSGLNQLTHTVGASRRTKMYDRHAQITYPKILSKNGYQTGFAGKTHVSFEGYEYKDLFDEGMHYNQPFWQKQPDGTKKHTTNLITEWALQFINKQAEDTPFCLSLSYNAAHADDKNLKDHFPHASEEAELYNNMIMPGPTLWQPEYNKSLPKFLRNSIGKTRYNWRWNTQEKYQKNLRNYYRLISGIDRSVGTVLDALEESGFLENTVVIFLADNGYAMGDRGLAGKWTHFEESLRVPFIIRDFRKADTQETVIDSIALNLDIAPTLLDYANVEAPSQYAGLSLKPIIDKQAEPEEWREDFYCEFLSRSDKAGLRHWQGVRDAQYTYARYEKGFKNELEILNDRSVDPTQLNNVIKKPKYKEVLKEKRERLKTFIKLYQDQTAKK